MKMYAIGIVSTIQENNRCLLASSFDEIKSGLKESHCLEEEDLDDFGFVSMDEFVEKLIEDKVIECYDGDDTSKFFFKDIDCKNSVPAVVEAIRLAQVDFCELDDESEDPESEIESLRQFFESTEE